MKLREAPTEDVDFSECLIVITFHFFSYRRLGYIVREIHQLL